MRKPAKQDHNNFSIRPLNPGDREWLLHFFTENWGSELMVIQGLVYRPADLPGFVAMQDGNVAGLITYRMDEDSCMIGSLDSLQQSMGIGSALIEAVKGVARQAGCKRVWLITTNDNLNALRFYQKRGFVLAEVRLNVMQKLRQVKPEIPLTGFDGIPIRDEIELEMVLG